MMDWSPQAFIHTLHYSGDKLKFISTKNLTLTFAIIYFCITDSQGGCFFFATEIEITFFSYQLSPRRVEKQEENPAYSAKLLHKFGKREQNK